MNWLLKIGKVKDANDIVNLRKLYSNVENCVRNLKILKVETSSFGYLLIPILQEKLPDDLKLLISRKFGGNIWISGTLFKSDCHLPKTLFLFTSMKAF